MHFQRHPMGHFAILGAEDALMSDQLSLCPNLTTSQQCTLLALAAKDTPRTGPSDEMVPSTKPWMALPSGCIAGSQEGPQNVVGGFRQFTLAGRMA